MTATATDVSDVDITGGRNPTLDQLDRPDTCEAETQRSPAKSQSDRDKPAELTILSGTTLSAFAVSTKTFGLRPGSWAYLGSLRF